MATAPNYRRRTFTNESVRGIQALTTFARIIRAKVLPYFAQITCIAIHTFADRFSIGFDARTEIATIITRTTASFYFTRFASESIRTIANVAGAVDLNAFTIVLAGCGRTRVNQMLTMRTLLNVNDKSY